MTVATFALDLSQNVGASSVSADLLAEMPAKFQAAAAKNCKVFGFNVYRQARRMSKHIGACGMAYTFGELAACCSILAEQCRFQAISGDFYRDDYSNLSKEQAIGIARVMLDALAKV
jgi:hypothetical protein